MLAWCCPCSTNTNASSRKRSCRDRRRSGPARRQARVRAFLHAVVDRVDQQSELLLVAETTTPEVRYGSGPYPLHHAHLVSLLSQIRPLGNVRYLAHALLAPLATSLVVFQRRNEGLSVA